jgi:hypothetical protein
MFVNLVSTGEVVSGDAAIGRGEDYTSDGSVRTYGSGRRRAIATAGEAGTFTFQMRYINHVTVNTLHSWIKQTVQVRDSKGRRFFGVYFGTAIEEVPATYWCVNKFDLQGAWHVGITLSVVTFVEGI